MCAIVFYVTGKVEIALGVKGTWIEVKEFLDYEWDQIYLESFYFAVITMITVGYGDISPTTYHEKIIVIAITFVSCGVFAYAVNTINIIVTESQTNEAIIKQKKFKVSTYMQKRHISKSTQLKVIKALEYINQQEEEENIEGLTILKSISKNLQGNILQEYFGTVLKNSTFAKNSKFSNTFLQSLSLKLQECTFGPGTQIYEQNQKCDIFYILVEGQIDIYLKSKNNTDSQEKIFKSIFGVQDVINKEFFKEQPMTLSYRTSHVARLVYFTKQDFIDEIKKSPVDYEKYCTLKDINKFKNRTGQMCFSCDSYSHITTLCPFLHLKLNEQRIIGQLNTQPPVNRLRYYRRQCKFQINNKQFNVISHREQYREDVMKVRCNILYEEIQSGIQYDIESPDIEFFYICPKILFNANSKYFCSLNEDNDDIDELFFEEYLEQEEEDMENEEEATYLQFQSQQQILENKKNEYMGSLNVISESEDSFKNEDEEEEYQQLQKQHISERCLKRKEKSDISIVVEEDEQAARKMIPNILNNKQSKLLKKNSTISPRKSIIGENKNFKNTEFMQILKRLSGQRNSNLQFPSFTDVNQKRKSFQNENAYSLQQIMNIQQENRRKSQLMINIINQSQNQNIQGQRNNNKKMTLVQYIRNNKKQQTQKDPINNNQNQLKSNNQNTNQYLYNQQNSQFLRNDDKSITLQSGNFKSLFANQILNPIIQDEKEKQYIEDIKSFGIELDLLKSFEQYFVHNNYSQIESQVNLLWENRMKKKYKSMLFRTQNVKVDLKKQKNRLSNLQVMGFKPLQNKSKNEIKK